MGEPESGAGERSFAPPGGRVLLGTVARILIAMLALLVAYFLFPMSDRDNAVIGVIAVIAALSIFAVVFWNQVRRIRHSAYPMLRAAESIVLVAMVFIVLMSIIATAFSLADSSNYSESLSRLDALYFTITTLATVGFGDITPTSPETRAFTMLQIVLGVALLGVGLRSLVVTAQKVREERASTEDPSGS